MKGSDDRHLILVYIYLAASCSIMGTGLVFATLFACQYLGIDITRSYWVLSIPVIVTLVLNVALVEVVLRIRRK